MNCSDENCERAVSARGLCKRHYEQRRRAGIVRAPCSIEGCGKPAKALGLCSAHYARQLIHGTTELVRITDRERYLSKCAPPNENGCRLWTAGTDKDGYGRFSTHSNGHQTHWGAHRYGYTALVGPVPEGMAVCHSCDVPACQSPEHWWLGTNQENTADKTTKGRAWKPRGEQVAGCKLTADQVREIRVIYARGGISRRALGERFSVTGGCIDGIVRRTTWAWLD